jgi:hypothetical protein
VSGHHDQVDTAIDLCRCDAISGIPSTNVARHMEIQIALLQPVDDALQVMRRIQNCVRPGLNGMAFAVGGGVGALLTATPIDGR